MLLYCVMTFTGSPRPDLSFALPYAINLAEMGRGVSDKRIGEYTRYHAMFGLTPCRLLVLHRGKSTRPPDELVAGQHPPEGLAVLYP